MTTKFHNSETHWVVVVRDYDPEFEDEVYVEHPDSCMRSEYGYHCEVDDAEEHDAILNMERWSSAGPGETARIPFYVELTHFVVPGTADEWDSRIVHGEKPYITT